MLTNLKQFFLGNGITNLFFTLFMFRPCVRHFQKFCTINSEKKQNYYELQQTPFVVGKICRNSQCSVLKRSYWSNSSL